MSQINPIAWFEIYVDDMSRARAFYQGVLQIDLSELVMPDAPIEMYQFPQNMEAMGASGALIKSEGMPPGPGGTLVYFQCEDCAVESGRVEAHGGTVIQSKMAVGEYGFIALATDTEGNTIGLFSTQ